MVGDGGLLDVQSHASMSLVCSLCVAPPPSPSPQPYVLLSGFFSWDVLFLNHSRAGHRLSPSKKPILDTADGVTHPFLMHCAFTEGWSGAI